jgi:hypothetical protein
MQYKLPIKNTFLIEIFILISISITYNAFYKLTQNMYYSIVGLIIVCYFGERLLGFIFGKFIKEEQLVNAVITKQKGKKIPFFKHSFLWEFIGFILICLIYNIIYTFFQNIFYSFVITLIVVYFVKIFIEFCFSKFRKS